MAIPLTIAEQAENSGPRKFDKIELVNAGQWVENVAPSKPEKKDFATAWNYNPGPTGHLDASGDKLRMYRPKVIAVWMRKGGVAKTNTTYQLGHALAADGIKTMMVDCDSQQDLTELSFRAVTEMSDDVEGHDDVQDYLRKQLPDTRTCASLADALRYTDFTSTTFDPFGYAAGIEVPDRGCKGSKLLKPYPFEVKSVVYDKKNKKQEKVVDNLFLVQGGADFDVMESHISTGIESYGTTSPKLGTVGAMFHAIWNAGHDCQADVILLDLSPAIDTTNELLLMHSDYFMVPCEANKLSEKNIRSIEGTFEGWYKKYQNGGVNNNERLGFRDISRGLQNTHMPNRGAELPLPEIEPKFLGLVLNKYDIDCRGIKRSADGTGIEGTETMKSKKRRHHAGKLLRAAKDLTEALDRKKVKRKKTPLTPLGSDGKPCGVFSVATDIFTDADDGNVAPPITGKDVFRHASGSQKYPQPYMLARVAKATQIFEACPGELGKPLGALEAAELDASTIKPYWNIREQAIGQIVHYRRIFSDLGKFIVNLPTPEPYNFVFDPQAGSGSIAETKIAARPGCLTDYPATDDSVLVDAKRTAGKWF